MRKKLLLGLVIISALFMFGCGDKSSEQTENSVQNETQAKDKVKKPVKPFLKTEEINVEANDRTVYGKGYRPDDKEKHPAIIMCHGYNGAHTDFTNECIYFAQNGYVAFAIDFCGGSGRSKSSGLSTDMTIFTEKEDLLAVFDYVSTMENVDPEQIYLFGGSQGGLVAAMAAEERADKVKGLALYFPAFNIPDNWRGNYKTEAEIPETVDFWGLMLGKNFFVSMRDYYSFESLGKFSKEVLIVQGDKDDIVPLSVAQRIEQLYSNAELVVLPGEAHGFTPVAAKKAMEEVLKFMQDK